MEHKILQKRGDLDMALALFKQLEGTLDQDNVINEILGIKKIVIEENLDTDPSMKENENQVVQFEDSSQQEVTDLNEVIPKPSERDPKVTKSIELGESTPIDQENLLSEPA